MHRSPLSVYISSILKYFFELGHIDLLGENLNLPFYQGKV